MKRILLIAGSLVAFVLTIALISGTRGKAQGPDSESKIQQGFAIAPVSLPED